MARGAAFQVVGIQTEAAEQHEIAERGRARVAAALNAK
jgi:hypothetical protein